MTKPADFPVWTGETPRPEANVTQGQIRKLVDWMHRSGVGRTRSLSQPGIAAHAIGPKGWLRKGRDYSGLACPEDVLFAAVHAGLVEPYQPGGICYRLTAAGESLASVD